MIYNGRSLQAFFQYEELIQQPYMILASLTGLISHRQYRRFNGLYFRLNLFFIYIRYKCKYLFAVRVITLEFKRFLGYFTVYIGYRRLLWRNMMQQKFPAVNHQTSAALIHCATKYWRLWNTCKQPTTLCCGVCCDLQLCAGNHDYISGLLWSR